MVYDQVSQPQKRLVYTYVSSEHDQVSGGHGELHPVEIDLSGGPAGSVGLALPEGRRRVRAPRKGPAAVTRTSWSVDEPMCFLFYLVLQNAQRGQSGLPSQNVEAVTLRNFLATEFPAVFSIRATRWS